MQLLPLEMGCAVRWRHGEQTQEMLMHEPCCGDAPQRELQCHPQQLAGWLMGCRQDGLLDRRRCGCDRAHWAAEAELDEDGGTSWVVGMVMTRVHHDQCSYLPRRKNVCWQKLSGEVPPQAMMVEWWSHRWWKWWWEWRLLLKPGCVLHTARKPDQ